MTRPTVTPTTERLYDSLKRGATSEAADAATGWTTLLLLASVADQLDPVATVVADTDDGPGWSSVLDVARCPGWALPWLGQFVGVTVPQGTDDDTARTIVRDEAGFGRGTVAALQAVTARFLKPGVTLRVYERTTDAYHLDCDVYLTWLLQDDYDDLAAHYSTYDALAAAFPTYDGFTIDTAPLNAALQAAKPIGLILTLNVLTHSTYEDLARFYPTYDALASAFTTYDAAAAFTPGS